ncbi:sugar kinase [[Mycoplasma] testudinis]|uniref:sugar kinase n=1 Tax=[Mycoplasma] testudinis TaxID=33924 RepID=UPI0004868865|nr:sugar kinase [[Mycoplasma] testudinis]
MNKKKILTFGEPLVLYTADQLDEPLLSATKFTRSVVGAEFNVLVGLTKLEIPCLYVGAVGDNFHGQCIVNRMLELKVDASCLLKNGHKTTGYMFKQTVSAGEPNIHYERNNTAFKAIDLTALQHVDWNEIALVHLTGISLAATLNNRVVFDEIINQTKIHKIPLSFDPNIRMQLWANEQQATTTINTIAKQATYFLPGYNEAKLLTGLTDPNEIMDFYLKSGVNTVFMKSYHGKSIAKNKMNHAITVDNFKVDKVVDVVGAGDGFAVGVLSSLYDGFGDLKQILYRANGIGAKIVSIYGDNAGYPTRNELEAFITQQKLD